MRRIICSIAPCFTTAILLASPCEFQTSGDPRNGLQFLAMIQVPDIGVASALGQIRGLAQAGGYKVGNDLITGSSGELSFVQESSRPPLIIRAVADSNGRVSLSLKLAKGQQASPADVQSELCGILVKLKGGKEGQTIAAAARNKSSVNQPIVTKAEDLSQAIGKEIKAAMAPADNKGKMTKLLIGVNRSATPRDHAEAFAPIRAKYIGQQYRVDGILHIVSRGFMGREMEISFLVTPKRGLLGIRQDREFNNLNFQIKGSFAKGQEAYFATLAEGDSVTITGIVSEINRSEMVLSDCRQANQ